MKNTVVLVVVINVSTGILAAVAVVTHMDPSKPNLMGPTPVSGLESLSSCRF
jgi:hypothetical protein